MTAAAPTGSTTGRVFCETSRALPLVSFTIAARTGALEDPAGKEGLFRITSRLVRRTGAGLSTEELDLRIDSLGGALGVDVGQSSATFQGTVISRSLDAFSDLLVGVIAKPSLSDHEFGKLKRETIAELVELRDHDRELAQRWFGRKLFAGHPYGRSVSGTPASIGAIDVQDVGSLHRLVTTSSNLVFAFAGDLDETRANAIAESVRAALPVGERRVDSVPEPIQRPGRHLVIVDKPERTQTQILIGCLGTHPSDPDHLALHVGNTIFGGTFTARLMQEVRAKRGWSYGAYSNLPYDRRRRGFSLWTFPKASDAAACIKLELELLEK
jgi:zinc protease